jgi:hypothetical protein
MSSIQLQKVLERIKNHVPRDQEDKHKQDVLNKYKEECKEIVYIKLKIDYDGFDKYGPQSKLYNFYVYYRINYNYYVDIWHREDWYSTYDDEPYFLDNYNTKYIDYSNKELIKYNHVY